MRFENYAFSYELKKSLARLKFVKPTDIQYKSIPSILKGEDVMAIAQTGTGKTAAFAIPIIEKIHQFKQTRKRRDGIQCIVLVPTHELAIQIHEVFVALAKETKVTTACIIGGVSQDPQIKKLNTGVDIIISTPGRMFDLISQGHLLTHRVNTLVLDEADHMMDLGFIDDIYDLMRKIPKKRQTLFFSATINEKIKKLAYSLVKNAIRIQISPKNPVAKNIDHSVLFIEMDDKRFFLERIIKENPEDKIMVFVRTRVRAERVTKAMLRAGIQTVFIHGDIGEEARQEIISSFRSGNERILVATDITARGLDIKDVTIVVNYDIPDVPENYVHRVGRTGRAKKRGLAYSFCAPTEKKDLERIEKMAGDKIKELRFDKSAYKETLEIQFEKNNDYKALLREIESFENRKKRKKK